MDFSELLQSQKKNDTPLIQVEVDPNKYLKIVSTLCEKRKALELKLQDQSSQTLEEDAISLIQLKESMATFGITEIQYHAYLAKTDIQATPEEQLPSEQKESAYTQAETPSEDEFRD